MATQLWLYIKKSYIPEIFLATASILMLFYGLNSSGFSYWDELTNVNVVRESGASFDLKYFSQPFYEKPPLWYFLTGVLQTVFGEQVWVYRILSAFSGAGFTGLIYHFSRKYYGHAAGIFGVLCVLLSSQLFAQSKYIFSTHTFRSADLDALNLLFMLISLLSFGLVIENYENIKRQRYLLLASVFTGLAFMTKGAFAFLPLIVYLSFFGLNYRKYKFEFKDYLLPAILGLIIILPWHIFMYLEHGKEFIDQYFGYHLLNRAGNQLEEHKEKFYFYFTVLAQSYFFISHGLLLLGLIRMACQPKLRSSGGWWSEWRYFFPVFGLIFTFILLSLIQTKLAWYVFYLHLFSFFILGWYLSLLFKRKGYLVEYILATISVIYTISTQFLR